MVAAELKPGLGMTETRLLFHAVTFATVFINFIGMAVDAVVVRLPLPAGGLLHGIMAAAAAFILMAIHALVAVIIGMGVMIKGHDRCFIVVGLVDQFIRYGYDRMLDIFYGLLGDLLLSFRRAFFDMADRAFVAMAPLAVAIQALPVVSAF